MDQIIYPLFLIQKPKNFSFNILNTTINQLSANRGEENEEAKMKRMNKGR